MKDFDRRLLSALLMVSLLGALGQIATYRAVVEQNPKITNSIESRLALQVSMINTLQRQNNSKVQVPILETYLQFIRKDGLISHTATKKKIDQLAANTEALLVLMEVMQTTSSSLQMRDQINEFRRYATAWLDRRNSIMDLYLLGGNFPPGEPEFPKELLQALKQSE